MRVAAQLRCSSGLMSALLRTPAHQCSEQTVAERALTLLEMFDLQQRAADPARTLSYGHQKKLEIVRALATSPRVLLLDEPAAGLNSREKRGLADSIRDIRSRFQVAILLIDHDMGLVMNLCEQIVVLDHGVTIGGTPPHRIARSGIVHVPEGRGIFPSLTVDENLMLGAFCRSDRPGIAEDRRRVLDLLPRIRERLRQKAGTLSGDEQQMLAVGRALLAAPRLLMLDEPTLGLSPQMAGTILDVIRAINQEGTTILLVEQNARMALELAHRAYVLELGMILTEGAAVLLGHPLFWVRFHW